MLEGVHYIAIEGPVGVGKTTLARALAKRLDARLVLEPAEQNPFLEKFYGDMPKYALATQLAFLVSRHKQQADLLQRDLFSSMVVSDYMLAKDGIFAALTLSDAELALYHQLHEAIAARAARPDIVVLLQADSETLMSRIRGRAIPYECGLSREYIERLVAAYDDFFRVYAESPVIVVDTSHVDYSKGGIDLDELIAGIELSMGGRGAAASKTPAR